MTFLSLLLFLTTPVQASNTCVNVAELSVTLRGDLAQVDDLLAQLLDAKQTPAELHRIGLDIEELLIAAEWGRRTEAKAIASEARERLTSLRCVPHPLAEALDDVLEAFETAHSAAATDRALRRAETRLGPRPGQVPVELASETGPQVFVTTYEHGGLSYEGLIQRQRSWEVGAVYGANPLLILDNTHQGGLHAGRNNLVLVQDQPSAYREDFLRGYTAGQDLRTGS